MSDGGAVGSERVIIVGGGVGGLTAALGFARAGHRVDVLERDPLPDVTDAEAAFDAERRGAPQVHQTHGFLARLVVELRERFPDVLDDLLAAGCVTMPTTAQLGEPRPGDEDLRVLIVRRTTLEWVLRRAVTGEAGVTFHTGVAVQRLLATPGIADGAPPRVTGVVTEDGREWEADIVVAATGRRGPIARWLEELGADVPETVHESGLMYLSRWYRFAEGVEVELDPKLGGDLGFVKYLAVPGDGGTLSITLAVRTDDAELRAALSDADAFEHACRILPGPDRFVGRYELTPLGGVRPMTGLLNRIRRFVDDGAPTVLGFHAIGDSHTCTNPLYGRGCALAAVQAIRLVDAAAEHPGDAVGRATAYEQAVAREVEPWFDISVQMDRMGADPAGLAIGGGSSDGGGGKAMAALFVAAATDPIIGRGMSRFWNLLALPGDLMADPELMTRMAEVMADPDAWPTPPADGPSRAELLEALAVLPTTPPTEEHPVPTTDPTIDRAAS